MWVLVALATAALVAIAGSRAATDPVSVFPSPGSRYASPHTQISFRGAPAASLGTVSVVGSKTGPHTGSLRPHSDGGGASFVMSRPFASGERVSVTAGAPLAGASGGAVTFTIAVRAGRRVQFEGDPGGNPVGAQHFVSQPGLSPPTLRVTTNSPQVAPGDIFTAVKAGSGQDGPMITDGNGNLLWFRRVPRGTSAYDLRVQQYASRPVLTWWQGRVSSGEGAGQGLIYDSSYRQVATVSAGNGYQADFHEFQLTPSGTAFLLAIQPVARNLRSVGGPAHGVVLDDVVQEVDVATGLVEFEWHSLDHVSPAESYFKPGAGPFDYFHANSVDLDPDGNLLVSARNTHAAYEIDRSTGQVLWRLGGKRSSFRMGAGASFVAQHDVRRAPDGTISVFDNTAPPATRARSRGIELSLDMQAMTATLVHSYTHPRPPIVAQSQGSAQVLPGGDVFIGWGGNAPYLSEFDSAGNLLFDAHFVPNDDTYRAYRLPWSGTPAAPPSVAARTVSGKTTVFASWNGATGVGSWQVLAGRSSRALRPVAAAQRSGFETAVPLGSAERWVAVRALDANGAPLATSRAIQPR